MDQSKLEITLQWLEAEREFAKQAIKRIFVSLWKRFPKEMDAVVNRGFDTLTEKEVQSINARKNEIGFTINEQREPVGDEVSQKFSNNTLISLRAFCDILKIKIPQTYLTSCIETVSRLEQKENSLGNKIQSVEKYLQLQAENTFLENLNPQKIKEAWESLQEEREIYERGGIRRHEGTSRNPRYHGEDYMRERRDKFEWAVSVIDYAEKGIIHGKVDEDKVILDLDHAYTEYTHSKAWIPDVAEKTGTAHIVKRIENLRQRMDQWMEEGGHIPVPFFSSTEKEQRQRELTELEQQTGEIYKEFENADVRHLPRNNEEPHPYRWGIL